MRRLVIIITLLAPCAMLIARHSPLSAHGEAIPSATPEKVNCKPCRRAGTDKPNQAPSVTDLELEKTELHIPLPEGSPPKYPDYSQAMRLNAKTTAADSEGDVLTYNYTVSGGRLVGTGANVTWDLNLVSPGTYTITAGVDDGCGVCGATITKSVTVMAHPETPKCVCPEVRIDSLNAKTTSSDPSFSVYISGPQPPGLKCIWTISEGTILSGQGTRSIRLRPPAERSGQPVTLTVEISGLDPACECPNTASRPVSY